MYFIFNDAATTEIYTLSLHDALPIWPELARALMEGIRASGVDVAEIGMFATPVAYFAAHELGRSEEHTSELQSHHDLVCRLLLEKKKRRAQCIMPKNKDTGT